MYKGAARGPAGPYTVERGIDRDTYHDGPRNLSDIANARPYGELESPHQDADANIDAERPSYPIRRVMINEETIRNLISSVLKTAKGDEEGEDENIGGGGEYEPGTKYFSQIAPYMDYVADLMHGYINKQELVSALESSSFAGVEDIKNLVEKAEKSGFGYRDKAKSYDALRRMVNEYGQKVLNDDTRQKFDDALTGANKAGLFRNFGGSYVGVPADRLNFKQNPNKWEVSETTTQLQFYDPAAIGKLPEVQTKYINFILDLVKGKSSTEEIKSLLQRQRIIDIAQGQFNVKRLNSVMRFMMEHPDTELAAALLVGLMLKETLGKLDLKSHIGEKGKLTISQRHILRNMSDNTKSLADRWIRSAVAILKMSGVMPEGEDYESVRRKILQNAITAAVNIANPLVNSMMGWFQTKQDAAERAKAEQAEREKMQQMDVRQPAPQPTGQPTQQPEGQPVPPGRQSSRDAELVSADVLKEITGPTNLRVVTPEEAEEGIEVGDEKKLKFRRSRYHAVSEMFARCGGD